MARAKTKPKTPEFDKPLQQAWYSLLADELDPERASRDNPYVKYQRNPRGFIEEVLGETVTDDIAKVFESILDNPVTIARSANGTGKTHGAARVAVWWYKCFPGAQVWTAAAPPIDNLESLLWGEIGSIVHAHPELFEVDDVTYLHIERHPKEFIEGVSIPQSGTEAERKAKFSGKHAPYILFIVDEGDAIPAEIYEAIETCMSGGVARLLVQFNPRAEAGPVYLKERDHQANVVELSAFTHPNVVTGEDIYPGAVTREITVRRINEWTREIKDGEKVDESCFEVPDFLVGCTAKAHDGHTIYPPLKTGHRKITFPPFSYMVLAKYPMQGENQLINKVWIYDARARWDAYVAQFGEIPPKGVKPILGLDIGELGPDESVCFPRYGGWVAQCRTWQGVDPLVSAENARDIYKELDGDIVMVDAGGVGSSVAPHLERFKCKSRRVMAAEAPTFETEIGKFERMKDQNLWSLREWLRTDHGAMLPPDEMLIEEMMVLTYETNKSKIKILPDKKEYRKIIRRSPDRLDALALTFTPEEPRKKRKIVSW